MVNQFKILIVVIYLFSTQAYPTYFNPDAKFYSFNVNSTFPANKVSAPWKERKNTILNFIIQSEPQIIALQGIAPFHLDDLLIPLQKEGFTCITAQRGKGWHGMAQDESLVLCWNNQFEVVSWSFFFINEPTAWPFSLGKQGFSPRICLWALLKSPHTGAEFCVMNIHLDHTFQNARLHAVKRIVTFIEENNFKCPIILAGTFNSDLYDAAGRILEQHGFINTKTLAQETVTLQPTVHYWGTKSAETVDHIYLKNNDKFTIKHFYIADEKAFAQLLHKESIVVPSSHHPVALIFQVPDTKKESL